MITISKEQAKIIASTVAPDIKAYITAHRVEYEEWLKTQDVKTDKNKTSKSEVKKERETWEHSAI